MSSVGEISEYRIRSDGMGMRIPDTWARYSAHTYRMYTEYKLAVIVNVRQGARRRNRFENRGNRENWFCQPSASPGHRRHGQRGSTRIEGWAHRAPRQRFCVFLCSSFITIEILTLHSIEFFQDACFHQICPTCVVDWQDSLTAIQTTHPAFSGLVYTRLTFLACNLPQF